jgi:peptidoglycan/LPS O-acetylase OafA/YrhL
LIVHFVPVLWQREFWFTVAFPPARVPEFVTGMCIALLVGRGWRPVRELGWLAAVALAIMPVAAVALPDWTSRLWAWQLWSLPWMAVIVAAGAARDLSGAGTHPTLVRLGDWSYALYLVHYPVLQRMDITLGLTDWAWVAALSVTSLVLAGIAHEAVERPVERFLRRLPVGERHEVLGRSR